MGQPTTCLATGRAGFQGIDFVRHLLADHHPLLETDPPWEIGPHGEAKVRPAGWTFKTAGLDFIVPIEQGAARP